MRKIGALEAGGTKFVMAVLDEQGAELERRTIPTEAPQKTLPAVRDFFEGHRVDALGIASFGPLELNEQSPHYGSITSTPKAGWQQTPLLAYLQEPRGVPGMIDTDVNAAAIAEYEMGAAKGADSLVYVTVGTGVGGGVVLHGKAVHGMVHPEIGHMLLRPAAEDPLPRGICPFHDGCLEGLASGPALKARLGYDASQCPEDDPVFQLEVHYLAQMCHQLMVMFSPQKIILGGGVMARKTMLAQIRRETLRLLNGYIQSDEISNGLENCIVAPKLFPVSGLWGAYILGKRALEQGQSDETNDACMRGIPWR